MLALKNNHSLSDISFPCVYGNVLSKTKMVKSDIYKLGKSMENLIRKGYDLAIIVHSLKQVYFAKHVDNLLVQLATK